MKKRTLNLKAIFAFLKANAVSRARDVCFCFFFFFKKRKNGNAFYLIRIYFFVFQFFGSAKNCENKKDMRRMYTIYA